MITEERFPLLAWTGYSLGQQPEHIPIAALEPSGVSYMASSRPFQALITLFDADRYQGNSLQEKITKRIPLPANHIMGRNLYLTPGVAQRLGSDLAFRNSLWPYNSKLPSGAGSIVFGKGAQYTYRVMNESDVLALNTSGYLEGATFVPNARLVMTATFVEDTLLAFELGYLTGQGLVVDQCSYRVYSDSDPGQYLSFTLVTLSAWLQNKFVEKRLNPGEGINQTRQPITVLTLQ